MSQKRKSPDRPVCFAGKVIFEFFGNNDEEFKQKSLQQLCKEVRKLWNVSCTPIEDQEVENPERGVLVLAIAAPSHEKAQKILEGVLAHFDANAPARILDEDIEKAEIC